MMFFFTSRCPMASAFPAAPSILQPDLTGVCFRDQIFLNYVGEVLSIHNVFDYFANSPFYDRSCNNEQLRMRGVHPLDMPSLTSMLGLEYIVSHAQEPHLFIFKKQKREGPEKASAISLYYILDGSVYQAPTMYGVMGSRMGRALHHIRKAFSRSKIELEKKDHDPSVVKAEELKKGSEKNVDVKDIIRMDSILASVFRKLPAAPIPPDLPKPVSAIDPSSQKPDEKESSDEKGTAAEGPNKRLKTEP